MPSLSRAALLPTVVLALVPLLLQGCAAMSTRNNEPDAASENEKLRTQIGEMRNQMTNLGARLDGLEGKLAAMNDKFDMASGARAASDAKSKNTPVVSHPADASSSGTSADAASVAAEAASDPEAGFAHDRAVQDYRQAMVLSTSGRHSDAVLAFSKFLENYPDHPLAGSAQYHLGDAYLQQKEYKLAIQELSRVLTSYDRSSHVAETLLALATAEDALKRTADATRHRQLLSSLFPQSPAAGMAGASASAEAGTPAAAAPAAETPTAPMAGGEAAAPAGGH